MGTIKLEENQNLFDAALQEYGSMEGLFDILEANNLTEITSAKDDTISVYSDLKIEGDLNERAVVEYYIAREKKPATALTPKDLELSTFSFENNSNGIGCMIVEDDFIVHDNSDAEPITCIEKIIYNKIGNGIGYMTVGSDNKVK